MTTVSYHGGERNSHDHDFEINTEERRKFK
jgi:hypothetical protein